MELGGWRDVSVEKIRVQFPAHTLGSSHPPGVYIDGSGLAFTSTHVHILSSSLIHTLKISTKPDLHRNSRATVLIKMFSRLYFP